MALRQRLLTLATAPSMCAAGVFALLIAGGILFDRVALHIQRPERAFELFQTKFLKPQATVIVKDVPLHRVIDELSRQTGVPIHVDWNSFEGTTLRRDTPVTTKLKNVKLSKVLSIVLQSAGDSRYVLSSKTLGGLAVERESEKHLVTRRYRVRFDLVRPFSSEQDVDLFEEQISQLVTDTIDSDSWKVNGGTYGDLWFEGDYLVARHFPAHQTSLQELFVKLFGGDHGISLDDPAIYFKYGTTCYFKR